MNNIKKKKIKAELLKISIIRIAHKYFNKMLGKKKSAISEVKLNFDIEIDEDLSLNSGQSVYIDNSIVDKNIRIGIVKDSEHSTAYWPKYQKFCETNLISYGFYDVFKSTFIEEATKFDVILWRVSSDPATLEMAKVKIKILEDHFGIICYPSSNSLFYYENKIAQYYLCKIKNLWMIPTFISSSMNEVMDALETIRLPVVTKLNVGSGSLGVSIIHKKSKLKAYSKKVFFNGADTYWGYLKQKDYVLFQEFIPGAKFDLRIIVVGNKYFGYYRDVAKNDFRASGANGERFGKLPKEAMDFARNVKECYPPTPMLAVDFLFCENSRKYLIIEMSIFYRIDFPSETIVDKKLGYYEFMNGNYQFKEGKYWVQELALKEFLEITVSKVTLSKKTTNMNVHASN